MHPVADALRCLFCQFLTVSRAKVRTHPTKENSKKGEGDDHVYARVKLQSWSLSYASALFPRKRKSWAGLSRQCMAAHGPLRLGKVSYKKGKRRETPKSGLNVQREHNNLRSHYWDKQTLIPAPKVLTVRILPTHMLCHNLTDD